MQVRARRPRWSGCSCTSPRSSARRSRGCTRARAELVRPRRSERHRSSITLVKDPRGVTRARRLQAVRPLWMIALWIVSVALISLVGALGYMILQGWNLLDALYMAVITLTTTGFREVHPLTPAGQVWTMFLSVVAIGIIFGTVGIVAEQTVGEVWTGRRGQRLMQRLVDSLSGHFIICGYGRVGSLVARDLTAGGLDVVVLDIGEDSLARAEADGYPVIHGDGTSDAVLLRAGIKKARGLVSCIDSDASNVYVTCLLYTSPSP